jgi:hypothetical protein
MPLDIPVAGTTLALLPTTILDTILEYVERDMRNKYPKKLVDVEMLAVGRVYHTECEQPLGFLAHGRDVLFLLKFASGDTEIVKQRYAMGPGSIDDDQGDQGAEEKPIILTMADYQDLYEGPYIGLPFLHSDYLVSTIRQDGKVIWDDADDTLYYDCTEDENYYDANDGDGFHEITY